jgi:Domain of unknown function (DUF4403)
VQVRLAEYGDIEMHSAKFKLWWLLVLIPVLAFIGIQLVLWWNHFEVLPPEPAKSAIASIVLPAATSHLSAPVSFQTSAIAAVLEAAIPKTFPFDSKNGARAFGSPSRGPVTVSTDVAKKRVAVATPVSGRVQVEKTVVVRVSVGIDVSGSITASFSPVIGSDWTIRPQLELSVHVNNAVAKTAVGDIGVTGLVQGGVNKALNGIKPRVEEALAKALHVRPKAENLWNKIHDAYRLAENPPTWLRITPQNVTFANFRYTQNSIESGLALALETHVFLQDTKPEVAKTPLPNLEILDQLSDEFNLSIPVEVSYALIDEEVRKQLSKGPVNLPDNAWVQITGATLQPYGDGVLLTVDFKGKKGLMRSASGRLYVVGIPMFDAAKSELRVDKLKYTAETESLLLRNVEWLAHSSLLDAMKKAAVVNLKSEMAKATEKANQQLEKFKRQLPKEVGANVAVTGIGIDRLAFAKDKAFAVVNVKGKMSASLVK